MKSVKRQQLTFCAYDNDLVTRKDNSYETYQTSLSYMLISPFEHKRSGERSGPNWYQLFKHRVFCFMYRLQNYDAAI